MQEASACTIITIVKAYFASAWLHYLNYSDDLSHEFRNIGMVLQGESIVPAVLVALMLAAAQA